MQLKYVDFYSNIKLQQNKTTNNTHYIIEGAYLYEKKNNNN